MSIGIRRNIITVQDLYNYALKHNYVNSDAFIVLEIISKEKSLLDTKNTSITNNTTVDDFNTSIEYTIEDVFNLLST